MIELSCPVRGCSNRLDRAERGLGCAAGHSFGFARNGTLNLLQPQDRRSPRPGDPDAAVDARRAWVERGHADGLVAAAGALVDALDLGEGATVLDVGCGDGYLTTRLTAGRGFDVCGIDLATRALAIAAHRMREATWVVANADRRLPLATASVDLALSLFGRRNAAELQRVLRPAGPLLVAVPGADDLVELRRAVLGRGLDLERTAKVIDDLASHFALATHRTWRETILLDAPAITDALAMTYRGSRKREAERAQALDALTVTLSAELLLFRAPN